MCGLNGIISYRAGAEPVDPDELVRTRDAMIARGPDGCGSWISDDRAIGLAHRRLSIIDLSEGGAQPMHDPESGAVIVFNGEIYNYREIRSDLEARGHVFRSGSDTEVLLRGYLEYSTALLPMLRGMFAFAIWDARKRGLLLARDPLGIKPLYLADDGQTLRFASQVRALLAGGGVKDLRPDPAGRVGFYLWGSVPSPYTLYRGIHSLPAGYSLWIDRSGVGVEKPYFDLNAEFRAAERRSPYPVTRDEGMEMLRAALSDSVRHHLIADVPVGVFLSAGVDSSSIASLASEHVRQGTLQTLTLGFEEFNGTMHDETPLATEIARLIGSRHSTVTISQRQFNEWIPSILAAMDQPSIDGVNSYCISRVARDAGLKVVLSGLGGDELYRGYSNFRDIPRQLRWTRIPSRIPGLGTLARMLSSPILQRSTKPKAAAVLELGGSVAEAYFLRRLLVPPWELDHYLDRDLVREGLERLRPLERLHAIVDGIQDPQLQIAALETSNYMRSQLLRDSDWASMGSSIELRVPLVDTTLLRAILTLVSRGFVPHKPDVSRATNPAIFALLAKRPKTGFAIPVVDWMRSELDVPKTAGGAMRIWAKYLDAHFSGHVGR
ncbi:MAG: asparagine synthase (glutamine-hydrolyzing) [Planctomycetaceae bacterium]|nr:asparagine synthase (glutamine-hydrolyzing) [Planctomycetaceae bacterium]